MPVPTDTGTSASLLERLRSPEDQAAWRDFAGRYGPKIYKWCLRWNLQQADAEDVTQNVLLKLAAKLRTFAYDRSRSFRAWLKTLTHHAWRDYVDSRRPGDRGSGDNDLARLLDNQQAPDTLNDFLENEHQRALLENAMALVQERVEPRTWAAFRLLALEQNSGSEVADHLGQPITAVFMARYRVQNMLREEIRRLEDPAASAPV
jgi:RNA polymerase sigma-70 factor (ECF subfamily)